MIINKTIWLFRRLRRCCVQQIVVKLRRATFTSLVLCVVCVLIAGLILLQWTDLIFKLKPYYLVDEPKYVFIDNDHNDSLVQQSRPACSPYNMPMPENVRVVIDNRIYPQVVPLNQNRHYNFTCLNSTRRRPLILVWNSFGGFPMHNIPDGPFKSENCPVNNCEITKDRGRVNDSSYVLFHMRAPIEKFPPIRFSRQKWVYVIYESQQNCAMCTQLEGYFNLSATFRCVNFYLLRKIKKLN